MTDFLPQKTNQLAGGVAPERPAVIFKGSTTITMSAQGTGFGGSASLSMPFKYIIGTTIFSFDAMTTGWNLGGGVLPTYALPFSNISMSLGTVSRSGSIYILSGTKDGFFLNIDLWDRSISQVITVYYQVSTKAYLSS